MESPVKEYTDHGHWGEFTFPCHQSCHWLIHQLQLSLTRLSREWQVSFQYKLEENSGNIPLRFQERTTTSSKLQRHLFRETEDTLSLLPCLPDRSVVIRPAQPSTIHPGEKVTLYVGTPVWVKLVTGSGNHLLQEIPTQPLSDTWFGANTRSGELCYLLRTRGRTQTGDISFERYRALTPVTIENHASTPLNFERFCLPLPMVSLYQDESTGQLSTQEILVKRGDDDQAAELKIQPGAPSICGQSVEIAPPRRKPDRQVLVKAFSSIFSGGGS